MEKISRKCILLLKEELVPPAYGNECGIILRIGGQPACLMPGVRGVVVGQIKRQEMFTED